MLNNRDAAEFLNPLARHVASARTVAIPGEENAHDADALAMAARAAVIYAGPSSELVGAIRSLTGESDSPGRILICGSLYLAGAVLAMADRNGFERID